MEPRDGTTYASLLDDGKVAVTSIILLMQWRTAKSMLRWLRGSPCSEGKPYFLWACKMDSILVKFRFKERGRKQVSSVLKGEEERRLIIQLESQRVDSEGSCLWGLGTTYLTQVGRLRNLQHLVIARLCVARRLCYYSLERGCNVWEVAIWAIPRTSRDKPAASAITYMCAAKSGRNELTWAPRCKYKWWCWSPDSFYRRRALS